MKKSIFFVLIFLSFSISFSANAVILGVSQDGITSEGIIAGLEVQVEQGNNFVFIILPARD